VKPRRGGSASGARAAGPNPWGDGYDELAVLTVGTEFLKANFEYWAAGKA
jgi:hypothetical protein